ncbi:MAG: hypothetical protein ACHQAQ_17200 [Hyphomicrobiales bacterium]|jgi:hypothetical protein
MRTAICIGLSMMLAGCVTAQRQESPEQLKARSEQATAACRAQPLTSYVARAQCLNDAAMIAASTSANPDLLQRALAARLLVAQRVDAKQLTPEQGAKEYARTESELSAEAQKRQAANGE